MEALAVGAEGCFGLFGFEKKGFGCSLEGQGLERLVRRRKGGLFAHKVEGSGLPRVQGLWCKLRSLGTQQLKATRSAP